MSQAHASLPSPVSSSPHHVRAKRLRASVEGARAPRIAATCVVFPEHRHPQAALSATLLRRWDAEHARALVRRLHPNVGVETRSTALPLDAYAARRDFGEANDDFIRIGTDLAARAIVDAADAAGIANTEIDAIFFTTVTGVAAPSIDARVVNRLGLRADIRRTPMFGLGCLGGAAGLARASDYLRAYPEQVAVLLSVELCSLTLQEDHSIANVVASGLFGDAAAAVVLTGSEHQSAREDDLSPRVIASRSAFFPGTERVMGWDVGATGFKVVLSADVPKIAAERLPAEVDRFLEPRRLSRRNIQHWICHPGGPKVIAAFEAAFDLPPDALAITRASLAREGNLSSASVLDVLRGFQRRAVAGDLGLLIAMGPGFSAELVLLEW